MQPLRCRTVKGAFQDRPGRAVIDAHSLVRLALGPPLTTQTSCRPLGWLRCRCWTCPISTVRVCAMLGVDMALYNAARALTVRPSVRAEHHPLLRGGTVSTAHGMQVSGVLDRLLVYVVSVQRAYNGECFISLKDPTGSIGGTLTADVLEAEPDVRRGSVVLLQKVGNWSTCQPCCVEARSYKPNDRIATISAVQVAVLRTPPPCVLHHLCITGNCIGQVIPAASMHGGSTSLHVSNPTVPMLPAAQSGLEAATSQQIVSNATGQVLSNRANHAAPMLRNPLPKSAMHAVAQATPTAAPGCLHNGIDDLLSGLDGEFDL